MKIRNYSNLNKSTTTSAHGFLINLKKEYGDATELNLSNRNGGKFNIFLEPLKDSEKDFEDLATIAISFRTTTMEEYLSSGYITSEINSSLRAEGVHSSRKIVDAVLKAKKEGKLLSDDEVTKLISNYYDALNFILSKKEFSARNLNTLYGIVSADLPDVIEEGSYYRENTVSIGADEGMDPSIIKNRITELIDFVNSESLGDHIQTKALVAHYIFENIHPYYEYNGRIGRLIHLWVLINNSREEFWKMTYLSEAIYSFKSSFDTIFDHILKAKKKDANIDVTYFVGSLLEIFNKHTRAYIEMKMMTDNLSKLPSRHLRLFIIDIICESGNVGKWYTINDFKRRYSDYSTTTYDRLLQEIKETGLFDIRKGKPIQFRIKNKN